MLRDSTFPVFLVFYFPKESFSGSLICTSAVALTFKQIEESVGNKKDMQISCHSDVPGTNFPQH